jgi:hypothetical protein
MDVRKDKESHPICGHHKSGVRSLYKRSAALIFNTTRYPPTCYSLWSLIDDFIDTTQHKEVSVV